MPTKCGQFFFVYYFGYATFGLCRLGPTVWAPGHLSAGRLGAILVRNRHSQVEAR